MKALRLLLLLIFAVFHSAPALADVTGNWFGWGEWLVDGQGPDCPNMTISFRENATEFRRLGGTFDCGVVVLHSDPLRWAKVGTQLFLDGKPAGESSKNGFVAYEPYDDEVTVRTAFTREGSHADYDELWTGANGKEIYHIRGRLFLRSAP